MRTLIVILTIPVFIGLALIATDYLETLSPVWTNLLAFPFFFAAIIGVVFVVAIIQNYFPKKRPTPEGYVGRFRRLDGVIVHVGRLRDGKLMVASESDPGVTPKDLGNVTGRELAMWTKLAATPDG